MTSTGIWSCRDECSAEAREYEVAGAGCGGQKRGAGSRAGAPLSDDVEVRCLASVRFPAAVPIRHRAVGGLVGRAFLDGLAGVVCAVGEGLEVFLQVRRRVGLVGGGLAQ